MTFDPSRIAQKLTAGQFEALRLSGEGWPLSYYRLPGGYRSQIVGQPYWALRKGRNDVPDAPHWRVATSLQDMGLIDSDNEWALITDRGRQVLASAIESAKRCDRNGRSRRRERVRQRRDAQP